MAKCRASTKHKQQQYNYDDDDDDNANTQYNGTRKPWGLHDRKFAPDITLWQQQNGTAWKKKKMYKRWSKHISPRVRRKNYIRTIIIKHPWSDNTVISNLYTRLAYRSTDTLSCQGREFPQVRKKSLNIPTFLIKGCFGARDGGEMSLVAMTTGIADIEITT